MRYLFRLYNLPQDTDKDTLQGLLENWTTVKNIWVAKDQNHVCQGWAWIEFHTEDDKELIKSYLNGMTWRGQKLFVLE
jgi:hypothetical protein